MRKDAIYYNLHMPWENTWLAAPTRYTAIRAGAAGPPASRSRTSTSRSAAARFWHAVISIKKQPGEGKNALLAALSVMDLKHVVVVDDDIDVNDPTDVEWAIATRVQGDKDVMIVIGRAGEAARPEPAAGLRRGADRRQGRHRRHHPGRHPASEHYERITYAYADTRQDRRLRQRQGGRGREGRRRGSGRGAGGRDPGAHRQGAALLSPTSPSGSRPTISTPSRARSATCTPPRSSGRTRAGACACAARSSRRSRRGADGADRNALAAGPVHNRGRSV